MGYIEQTDVGNVYTTDINDWFATLSNLNRECKNYIDSEIRYKEILAEHDKQIREDAIESIESLDTITKTEYYEWDDALYKHHISEDVEYVKLDDVLKILKGE